MKKINNRLFKFCLAFFLFVTSLFGQTTPVKAIDTSQNVMDLVIDGSALSMNYSIDHIDRFNQYGIAIISSETLLDDGVTKVQKYGLMNSSGDILLNPIYDDLKSFDIHHYFYLVTQIDTNGVQTQGLYSQQTGLEVLPIQYSYIPPIDGKTLLELGYLVTDPDSNELVWRNEVYGYDESTGSLSQIYKPSGLPTTIDSFWIDKVTNSFYIVYAQVYSDNQWHQHSWLIDKYGNQISSLNSSYDWIQYFQTNGSNYLITQSNSNGNWSSQLYQISISGNTISATQKFSDYDYIWFNPNNDYIEISDKTSSNNWYYGRYDLVADAWVSGYTLGEAQDYEFPLYDNNDLMMVQSCGEDLSNNFSCHSYLYDKNDPDKTNIFGAGNTYNGIFVRGDLIYVNNGNSASTISGNVLKHGTNGYFKLFSEDVNGFIWQNNIGWLQINQMTMVNNNEVWNNTVFDISNVDATTSWTSLVNSDALLVSNGYTSEYFNRYHFIQQNLSDGSQNVSLYDQVTQSYILRNKDWINLYNKSNNTILGVYQDENNSFGFTYHAVGTNVSYRSYENVLGFSDFNNSGYAKVYTNSNKVGLIDNSGNGSYVIDPNLQSTEPFDEHFLYDGTNSIVISKDSTGKYDYYLLGSSTSPYLADLDLAIKNENYPTLIKDGDGYAYIQGSTITRNELLGGATKVSPFSNGFSLIKASSGSVSAYTSDFTSITNGLTNVSDFVGNLVLDGSTIKFAILSNNSISTLSLPSSITNTTLSDFSQLKDNLYFYTISSGVTGLLVYNPNTQSLSDLGVVDVSSFEKTEAFYKYQYRVSNVNHSGFISSHGTVNLQDINNEGINYSLSDGYIVLNKYVSNSNQSTLFSFSGEPIFSHLDNSNTIVDYYNYVSVNGNILSYGSNSSNSTAIVTTNGINYYPNTNSNPVEGSNELIKLSKFEDGINKWGLIKSDGTVLFDINSTNPFTFITVDTTYKVILPEVNIGTDSYGIPINKNTAIYDLNGVLIPDLNGFHAEGPINKDGTLNVEQSTNYRRTFPSGCCSDEDIYLRNVYDFSTQHFLYTDYLYRFVDGDYEIVASLGDLENASAFDSNRGGDAFIKKVNGVWDTENQYALPLQFGLNSLSGKEIIPAGYYNYLDYTSIKDYIVLNNNENNNWSSGILDRNGYPVACVEAKVVNEVAVVSGDGTPIYNLTCENIQYNKGTNLFVFLSRNGDLKMTNFYDITNKQIINAGIAYLDTYALDQGHSAIAYVYANYADADSSNNNVESIPYDEFGPIIKQGVMQNYNDYLLEPHYDFVREFNGNGYATFGNYLENGQTIGLVHETRGVILDNVYQTVGTTYPSTNLNDTPNFDARGLLKIVKEVNSNSYVGLADENGELFDGAVYQYAYFQNGEFYLKKHNQDWMIIKDADITDVQMHGSAWDNYLVNNTSSIETFSLDLDFDISSLSRVSSGNTDYYIASYSIYDSVFNTTYDYYGILNADGSVYLDFDYSFISYNSVDINWNLEIYNTLYGTYQKAVMAMDKSFIVPFNNKYDSVSDYVDGYAIGTSGTAPETQQTSYNPFIQILTSLFLSVSATTSDEFVLEILDENGNVVGDLSDTYESVVLLGNVDGVTKALVKQNGQYYIATLTSVPFTGEVITAVEIDQPTLSMTLGSNSRLFAEVFPLTSTQPKTISWESSNADVVSVDGKGNIKALALGSATITLKVNQFTATSVITVTNASNPQSSSEPTTYTSSVTVASQNNLPTTTQILPINQLINFLSSTNTLTNTQFKTLFADSLKADEQFISRLTNDEKQALEAEILKVYEDQITLTKPTDIPFTMTGLINFLNLNDLVNGIDIEVQISISNQLDEGDQNLVDNYMADHQLDTEYMYPLNISITQISSDGEIKVSDVNGEVELTFALPSTFDGAGQLQIIKIHEGVVELLDVTISENHTFSFSTSQFSSFTLVKKEMMAQITEPVQDQIITPPQNQNKYIYWGLGALLLSIVGFIIYKRKVNA